MKEGIIIRFLPNGMFIPVDIDSHKSENNCCLSAEFRSREIPMPTEISTDTNGESTHGTDTESKVS